MDLRILQNENTYLKYLFGKTDVIKYLVKDVKEHPDDESLMELSYHTKSNTSSVVQEDIRGYYFGTLSSLFYSIYQKKNIDMYKKLILCIQLFRF